MNNLERWFTGGFLVAVTLTMFLLSFWLWRFAVCAVAVCR